MIKDVFVDQRRCDLNFDARMATATPYDSKSKSTPT